MKNHVVLLVALLAASAAGARAQGPILDETVDYFQVPPAARQAFEANSGGDKVTGIKVHTLDNRPVYEFDLRTANGTMRRLRVTSDGQLLRIDGSVAPAAAGSPTISLAATPPPGGGYFTDVDGIGSVPTVRREQLPQAVQTALDHEANGRHIAKITAEVIKGRRAYGVQFDGPAGRGWTYFGEDGAVLQQ